MIAVPGIKPYVNMIMIIGGEYWSFTPKSIEKLCRTVCDGEHFELEQFGNVKTATAYLYGLCVEDMQEEDFYRKGFTISFLSYVLKLVRNEGDTGNAEGKYIDAGL